MSDKKSKMLSDLSDVAKYLEEAGYVDKAKEVHVIMSAIDGEQYLVDHISDNVPATQSNTENQNYIGFDGVGGGPGMLNSGIGQPADDQESYNIYERLSSLPGDFTENKPMRAYIGQWKDNINDKPVELVWDLALVSHWENVKELGDNVIPFNPKVIRAVVELTVGKESEFILWRDYDNFMSGLEAIEDVIYKVPGIIDEKFGVEQNNVDVAVRSNGLRGITSIDDQNAGMFQGMNAEPNFSGGISYNNLEGAYG